MITTPDLSPMQERSIRESTARINLWTGSIRSGKTIASLLRWLIYVNRAPRGGQLVITGKTLDTVARNVFSPLQDPALFGRVAAAVAYTRGASTGSILGRPVEVITANDARSEGRLRGLTCAGAYVDELTLLPEAFFMQLLGRMSVVGAKLFGTTNPDGPAHWLRRKFLLRASELGLAHWQFKLDDNPSLDPAYVAALKAEYVGLWFRRFILGEWALAQGAIYDMFDPDQHVITGPAPSFALLPAVGVDYGTRHPFSAHLLGIQAADRTVGHPARLVLAREYRHDPAVAQRSLTDADYSRELRAWIGEDRPQWVAVDPSAASFKVQLYRDRLPNVVDADNAVADGIRLVSSLLATDRLVIHESCRGLLEELPSYSWDESSAERGEDKPVKVGDDSCDSARYSIKTTEQVWRPYLNAA